MIDSAELRATLPRRRELHRIVPSRFPPVGVFDQVADPADLPALFEIEALTNDRLRAERDALLLLPRAEWLSGPGSTPVMAAFTHLSPSRFSDGRFGVFYGARDEQTALRETVHHRERFLAATREPPIRLTMRRYLAQLAKPLLDGRARLAGTPLMERDSYAHSQPFGARLREHGAWGLLYPSARRAGGECAAIFRPKALSLPVVQAAHYHYHWDGRRIAFIEHASEAQW